MNGINLPSLHLRLLRGLGDVFRASVWLSASGLFRHRAAVLECVSNHRKQACHWITPGCLATTWAATCALDQWVTKACTRNAAHKRRYLAVATSACCLTCCVTCAAVCFRPSRRTPCREEASACACTATRYSSDAHGVSGPSGKHFGPGTPSSSSSRSQAAWWTRPPAATMAALLQPQHRLPVQQHDRDGHRTESPTSTPSSPAATTTAG